MHLNSFKETLLTSGCSAETKGKVFMLLVLCFLYKDLSRTSCVILAEGGWPKKVSAYQRTPLERFLEKTKKANHNRLKSSISWKRESSKSRRRRWPMV